MSENVGFVEISNDCTIRRNDGTSIETFPSGAVRYPTGRRYDLMSPQAVRICMPHSSVSILIDFLLFFLDKEAKQTLTTRQLCENLCKAMFHVIGNPSLSEVLDLYAQALEEGSKKYGDRNWEKGIPESNLVNHAIAHAIKIDAGDTSEDHVAHLIWNVFAIIHFRLKDSTDSRME